MQVCDLEYIPSNLHYNDKPLIQEFRVGEYLYRRSKEEELDNPFLKISLTELSVNRRGFVEVLSEEEDVLHCITPEKGFEKYTDEKVCKLEIKSLTEDFQYDKIFEQDDKSSFARIKLFHDPVPCMYPHCVFRIWLNDEIVTYDNYKRTLKKQIKLRNALKTELAKMIIRKEVRQQ